MSATEGSLLQKYPLQLAAESGRATAVGKMLQHRLHASVCWHRCCLLLLLLGSQLDNLHTVHKSKINGSGGSSVQQNSKH